MNKQFRQNFSQAYNNLYHLHPNDSKNKNLLYLNREWFFNNHLNLVLKSIKDFKTKYFPEADLETSLFGGLFHDAGLVFGRKTSSPAGHEKRSSQYATMQLKKLGYSTEFIKKTTECIKATEPNYLSKMPEAILVRNADAYSHLCSLHFFAKANFSPSINHFALWFSKKIDETESKISIPIIKKEIKPLCEKYRRMITCFNSTNKENKKKFLESLLNNL